MGDHPSMRFVLLHGLLCSARTLDRVAGPLRAAGHEVLVPDLPGHGTDAANPGAESIEEMAGSVRDVAAGPAVLVGHSMGGLVAVAVAEQDPAFATHVVAINAPATFASRLTARGGPERLLTVAGLGPLLWRVLPQRVRRDGLRTAFAPGTEVPDVFLAAAGAARWRTFRDATLAIDHYVHDEPLPERVAALDVPVTIVFGEQDARVDPATVARYEALEDGPAVLRIPQSGHSPVWETPERVVEVLLALEGAPER